MKKLIYIYLFINVNLLLALNNYDTLLPKKKANDTVLFSTINGFVLFKEVELNSLKFFDGFILDTGSNISVIDVSIYNKLKLKNIKDIENEDIDGIRINRKLVEIDSLRIGNSLFLNVKAIVVNINSGGLKCKNIKGIIGNNVLKNKIIKIDFINKEINFNEKLIETVEYIKIPFRLKNNLPYVDLKVGKREYKNCLFDLGNVNQIILKKKDLTTIDERIIEKTHTYHLFNKSINSTSYKLYKIYQITVKNATIKSLNLINAKINFSKNRLIGVALFYNSILILDYKNRNIYMNNSKISMKKNLKNEKFIKIGWNGSFYISQVKIDSLILKYDIKVGDVVNQINDIDLTNNFSKKNICEILEKLNKEIKKDTVSLNLERWRCTKNIY